MSRVALFGGLATGAAAVLVAVTVGDGWLKPGAAPEREDGTGSAPATDVTAPVPDTARDARDEATATTDTTNLSETKAAPVAPDAEVGSPTAGGAATDAVASPAPAPAIAMAEAPVVAQDDPAAPQPGATALDAPDLALAPSGVDAPPASAGAPEAPGASAEGPAMPETGVAMPAFDLVRAESDGSALVAGSAEPGARVEVVLGGAVAASTDVGRDGRFVVFLDLPDTGQAHVLALRQAAGDSVIVSLDEIIVAPRTAVAAAAPEGDDPGLLSLVDAAPRVTPKVPASPDLPGRIARIDAGQAGPEPDEAQAVDLPDAENSLARSRDMAAAIVAATPDTPAPAAAGRAAAPETELDSVPVPERPAPLAPSPGQEPATETVRSTDSATMVIARSESDSHSDPGTDGAVADAGSADGTGDLPALVSVSEGTSETDARTTASGDAEATPAAMTIAAVDDPGAESAAPQAPSSPTENAPPESPSTIGAAVEMAAAPAPEPADDARPMVLRSTPQGVEVMPDAPLDPGQVALDQITYDDDGAVRVAGRGDAGGTGGGFVRLYLDNAPVATAQIAADGRWRTTLPEVDSGTYTLRVDRIDAGGVVTARAESPFRRVDPQVLEATRAEGGVAVNVTVQPGNTLWGISRARYGEGIDYVRIFDANRDQIRDPDLIYPGQIFDLPE